MRVLFIHSIDTVVSNQNVCELAQTIRKGLKGTSSRDPFLFSPFGSLLTNHALHDPLFLHVEGSNDVGELRSELFKILDNAVLFQNGSDVVNIGQSMYRFHIEFRGVLFILII